MTDPILDIVLALHTAIGIMMVLIAQVLFFGIVIAIIRAGEIFVNAARGDWDRAVDICNGIAAKGGRVARRVGLNGLRRL